MPLRLSFSRRAFAWTLAIVVIGALLLIAHLTHVRRAHNAILRADPDAILTQPALAKVALRIGRSVYLANCARCHGDAGQADRVRGIPDLTDNDFLYGVGRVSEIELIVLHGIRAGDSTGWNLAAMPAFATAKPYAREAIPPLSPGEIRDVTLFLRGGHGDPAAAVRGRSIFMSKGGCYDCHGQDAAGDAAIGAPNLTDTIWLYGDETPASIYRSIAQGRAGTSPAFARHLTPLEARAVAVYVGSLNPTNRRNAVR